MLAIEFCRERQNKLLQFLERNQLAFAILSSAQAIHYYSGVLVDAQWPQALVISASSGATLITGKEPVQSAVSSVRTYTGYTVDRQFDRTTMQEEVKGHVRDCIANRKGTVAIESEFMPASLASALSLEYMNLTPWLMETRRCKYPDEIESIKDTIALAEAGYGAVRRRLKPGMTEVDAYRIMHEAMLDLARTSVHLEGDFGCGLRAAEGGPPTANRLRAGDLCIFDLFPSYNGYHCDLCRAFCVGAPSAEQFEAWKHVADAHAIARRLIRPGLRTSEVYFEIQKYLDDFPGMKGSFCHHAGHGVGQQGWEQPWLNAGGNEVFVKGEVIACEPGLYSPSLAGGIRLERNYLVTDDAPVALDNFPMEL